jgi:transcriptional regulator with XRE-family HTH domain
LRYRLRMTPAEEALTVVRVRSWLRSGRARAIRQQAGMSQADAGLAVGTDHAQISRWESRTSVPARDSTLKLASLYDALEEIIRDEEETAAARGITA